MTSGAKADAVDPYIPSSGNAGYSVQHYDLELTYRVASNYLDGWATLSIVALEPLRRVTFDLAGLKVAKVLIGGRSAGRFGVRSGKLAVTLSKPLAVGDEVELRVRYSGNPRPVRGVWGDVGWEELTDGVIVAGQPNGAASWFPCNDHPSDKATYRIALTVDSPYYVLSNGELTSKRAGASMTTWVYEQGDPMATYLATVQVGQYELFDIDDDRDADAVVQQAVVPAALRRTFLSDFGRQPRMMRTFEELFGPYPHAAYTVLVTADELEIPLEAQGISVFGANHVDGERGYERLVAHELAHQWFGNSLTVASWQHIWLNEGFACYAEWLWSDTCGGPSVADLAAKYHARLADQPQDLVLADPGREAMFDDRLYKRGALTLHALRTAMGDDGFFDLLRAWVQDHRHGLVTTQEFVAAVASAVDGEVAEALTPWLFEKALPDLP